MGMIDGHIQSAGEQMPAEQQRDANRIDPGPLPKWPIPARVPGRQGKYQVLMRRSVLNDIRQHALSNPEVEVCGVVLGTVYRDALGPWGFVAANIRGKYSSARNAQVTFTSETWTDIHQQMEARFPKQRILGWYHSHPGFGIFLSEMDVFIQEHFFAASWQIAFVDDPKGGDRGLFVWRSGKPVQEEFLIDEDLGASSGSNDAPATKTIADEQVVAPRRKHAPLWMIVVTVFAVVTGLGAFAIWWLR